MKSKIIKDSEVSSLKVSSLPTRPTASAAFGGKGYTASEMKAAFDKFPEYLLTKLNLLIEDLLKEGDESYVGNYKTGIVENQTLKALIEGIVTGEFAELLTVDGRRLCDVLNTIESDLRIIKERLGIF